MKMAICIVGRTDPAKAQFPARSIDRQAILVRAGSEAAEVPGTDEFRIKSGVIDGSFSTSPPASSQIPLCRRNRPCADDCGSRQWCFYGSCRPRQIFLQTVGFTRTDQELIHHKAQSPELGGTATDRRRRKPGNKDRVRYGSQHRPDIGQRDCGSVNTAGPVCRPVCSRR